MMIPCCSHISRKLMTRERLRAAILLAVVIVGIGIVLSAIRRPILRAAGWALVVNDHVEPADIIIVMVDANGAGVLEAADLVHSGMAARVAVFDESPDTVVEHEFVRRGIPYEDDGGRSVRLLKELGVRTIDLIPTYVAGTEDEGPVLAEWCDQHRFRSVVVVSTSDHSRRVRRVLHRSMKGYPTKVAARSARYSAFDPDRWWLSRRGTRTEVVELGKLLLDVARHPFS
jgi:microcompartment protein CcmK/EutM